MNLSFEEFRKKAQELSEDFSHRVPWMNERSSDDSRCGLENSWVVGGDRGGSCWGYEEGMRLDPEPESEIDLEKLLMEVYPQLSYLQFRMIQKLEQEYDYHVPEYYGNYTDYQAKYIYLDELYELLKSFDE